MVHIVANLDLKDDLLMIETYGLISSLCTEQFCAELYAEKLLLYEQMQSRFKITAWDFFTIQKKTVLTFLGAVIPFCVMAFQITQNDKSASNQVFDFSSLKLSNSTLQQS